MPGQVVNVSWQSALSEVALKCGDPFFRNFPRNIYGQAVYRAERGIAKEHGILDRVLTITNSDGDQELEIGPLNFNGEWRVTVTPTASDDGTTYTPQQYTRVQYEQVDNYEDKYDVPDYRYSINYIGNAYVFRYNSYAADDEINIYYTSSIVSEEDYETYDSQGNTNIIPVLPDKFYEETVRRAIIYIAELGIAKFDGLKAQKMVALLKWYRRPNDDMLAENQLERDRPWILIKALSTTFPGD